MPKSLIEIGDARINLSSPSAMPSASTFLWNSQMMIQVNCRGYARAQFMQPEPAKYAYAPNIEAKTFMQPEQPYFAHHPGRFIYIKDLDNNSLFSAPYEPVRGELDSFSFSAGQHNVIWRTEKDQIAVEMTLGLALNRAAELWKIRVINLSTSEKNLSITPYFPVGYMSWMNQSGAYHEDLSAVICRSVTPYQKYSDYFKQKEFKDLTYFVCGTKPESWEIRQAKFEGEGGLHAPSALTHEQLSNSDAIYEIPAAAVQYKVVLEANTSVDYQFAFGPAKDEIEIAEVAKDLFTGKGFERAQTEYAAHVDQIRSPINIATPDPSFDNFINHWLGRQIVYHGEVNRLSTDPQTRNYLQDNMGMSYFNA